MLPKKTILISAVMTAFVLSMLGGVAMALKQPVTASEAAGTPTVVAALTPQEAAAVASSVLNQQDVYSVESSSINGVDAYMVTFSSGQIAYVGLDGQILSITKIQPVVVAQNNGPSRSSSRSAPASPSTQSGGEHEGGEHDD